MTAPSRWRQADLDRILKAANKNGVRVRINPDGSIETLGPGLTPPHAERNPLDRIFDR